MTSPSSLSLPQVPASLYSGGKRKLFLTKWQPSPWFQTGKAFSLFLMFLSMRHRGCRGLVSIIFLAYLCPLTLSFPGQEEWLHLTGSLENWTYVVQHLAHGSKLPIGSTHLLFFHSGSLIVGKRWSSRRKMLIHRYTTFSNILFISNKIIFWLIIVFN